MQIYNQNNDRITNYNKYQGKLAIQKTLLATYNNHKEIPKKYLEGYSIRRNSDKVEVYAVRATVVPYTAEEKKALEDKETERLIAERYSVKQELAILRQKETKPEEFAEFFAFAEECKAKAKTLYNVTENA